MELGSSFYWLIHINGAIKRDTRDARIAIEVPILALKTGSEKRNFCDFISFGF